LEHSPVSRALSELGAAVSEFKEHYRTFAEKNRQFVPIQDEVQSAIQKAEIEPDIKLSAQIFEKEITAILGVTERKQEVSNKKWTGRLANFLSKLYPLASFSLRLTASVSEVNTALLLSFLTEGS
jgi:hypothetical protein